MKKILTVVSMLFFLFSCDMANIPGDEDANNNSYQQSIYVDFYWDAVVGEGSGLALRVKEHQTDNWQYFSSNIEGFNFESGNRYLLKMKATKISDPPMDGSSIKYDLLEIISQEKVDAQEGFTILVKDDVLCWITVDNNSYSLLRHVGIDFLNEDVKTQLNNALANSEVKRVFARFHHSLDYSRYVLESISIE